MTDIIQDLITINTMLAEVEKRYNTEHHVVLKVNAVQQSIVLLAKELCKMGKDHVEESR